MPVRARKLWTKVSITMKLGADIEPTRPMHPSPHQQRRQCHRNNFVGHAVDIPQRFHQRSPRRSEVMRTIANDLLIYPSDDVATGNITNKKKQAVRGLVEPAVP